MKTALSSVFMVVLASASAFAQAEIPKGWFLHDDQSPTLTLAYYDPASGDVDVSLNCTTGYSDVVVAFYPKSGDMTEGRSAKLELHNADATHSIDATGKTYNGRYAFDGLTTMGPALGKLLVNGFTISIAGQNMGTYTPSEKDSAQVRKLAEACIG